MKTVTKIKIALENCAHYNGGSGLILPPSLVEELKRLGVDGPYTVDEKIPQ